MRKIVLKLSQLTVILQFLFCVFQSHGYCTCARCKTQIREKIQTWQISSAVAAMRGSVSTDRVSAPLGFFSLDIGAANHNSINGLKN